MATEAFAKRALGEALREAIDGRQVRTAVFTTYAFDRDFFERHVLPLLFSRAFSKDERARLVELDEELRRSTRVAVYYDRGALDVSRGGGRLPIETIEIRRTTASGATKGCFHPKLFLALVSDSEGVEALVVGVLSANLTEDGHWTNVECAWFDEIAAGSLCSYRRDLSKVLQQIRKDARDDTLHHHALAAIEKFLGRVKPTEQRTQDGWFQTRLFFGQQSLAEFLRDELQLPADTYHLEVVAPFFDEGSAIRELQETLRPRSTLVYLPLRGDYTAETRREYFELVRKLPRMKWARFSDASYLRRSKREQDLPRELHAKIYRLWCKAVGVEGEFIVLGSPNLTRAAHSRKHEGNFEVAVVLENREPHLGSFLTAIERDPAEFVSAQFASSEVAGGGDEPIPLQLRFHWATKKLEARWDSQDVSPIITLRMSGVELPHAIRQLKPSLWIEIPELAAVVAEHLPQTTLVQVKVPNGTSSWVLVHEQDLMQKPSRQIQFTSEEILRYWSALSNAQRQAQLEAVSAREAAGPGESISPIGSHGMFERFAGIFHGFECLRASVEKAIEDDRPEHAVHQLFGAKHDSLRVLIEQQLDEKATLADRSHEPDTLLAQRYVTLLSAKRLLVQLESSAQSFVAEHGADVKQLLGRLQAPRLREQIAVGCGDKGEDFVRWFDDWFVRNEA